MKPSRRPDPSASERHRWLTCGSEGAFDQAECKPGTAFRRSSCVVDQFHWNAPGLDDREPPSVESDALRQKFGTNPVAVTGNRVDDKREAWPFHRTTGLSGELCGRAGTGNTGAVSPRHAPRLR